MTTSVQGAAAPTATGAGSTAAPTRAQGELGKEEFLKLLVAQLTNQDPLNPTNPEQFASQLAQFSSLEQLLQINENLVGQAGTDAALAEALHSTSALGAIGKEALVFGNRVEVGEGGSTTATIEVGGTGGTATIEILDGNGKVVGSQEVAVGPDRQDIDLGEAAGDLEPGWYSYRIRVENGAGETVDTITYTRGLVEGVRYGADGPRLVIGGAEVPLGNVAELTAA